MKTKTDIDQRFEFSDDLKFKKEQRNLLIAVLFFGFIGAFAFLYALALIMNKIIN